MKKKKYFLLVVLLVFVLIFYYILKNDKNNEYINVSNIIVKSNNEVNNNIEPEKIKIHITGQVNKPGLLELDIGSRIYDAIQMAEGLTTNADISKTNLAYVLSDGEKIYIPSVDDDYDINEDFTGITTKVNINTANFSELKTVQGIGESTANAIIEYRSKNGRFESIDDIKNVSGIGDSKFEKMKEYITVK